MMQVSNDMKIRLKQIDIYIQIAISVAALVFILFELSICLSGDAAIYFPFFKNFFQMPFSYFEGKVTYGATSVLWTCMGAAIYALFKAYWLIAIRIFNICLIEIAVAIINRTLKGNMVTYGLGLFTVLYSWRVVSFAVEGFEIGLMLFSIALLFYFSVNNKVTAAIGISGLLYLVRPELFILTIIFDVYSLWVHKINFLKWIKLCFISGISLIAYICYMGYRTGPLIPSSVSGRFIQSMEENMS